MESTSINLDINYIKSLFIYNDGILTWKHRPLQHFKDEASQKTWNSKYAGEIAGTTSNHNDGTLPRCMIAINRKLYLRSILVWCIHYNEIPNKMIDHIDTNSLNDKIGNLRLATRSQNFGNKRINKNNKCGFKGVSLDKRRGTYTAEICVERKRIRKGGFKTAEEAHELYMKLALEYFGEFANPGK
jgi:hypothetical protein